MSALESQGFESSNNAPPLILIAQESGYIPRPSDGEIAEIVEIYGEYSPDDLALSGLSNNFQEVIARVHLKGLRENGGSLDDLLLWTRYYTGISKPTENTYI